MEIGVPEARTSARNILKQRIQQRSAELNDAGSYEGDITAETEIPSAVPLRNRAKATVQAYKAERAISKVMNYYWCFIGLVILLILWTMS